MFFTAQPKSIGYKKVHLGTNDSMSLLAGGWGGDSCQSSPFRLWQDNECGFDFLGMGDMGNWTLCPLAAQSRDEPEP